MTRFLSVMSGCVSALALLAGQAVAQNYFQAPSFNDEFLVFSSEGDLWLALQTETGPAISTRLTTHEEVETNPKLSPNGKWIAFDANYDGPREVYLMPSTGGTPKRLTFEGGGVSVRGWTDDGHVLFQTTNLPGTIPRLLRTIDIQTLNVTDIPLADADQTTLSADGKTLFFTRYGLNIFSDNAVLYRGGRMAQLWSYAMGSDAEATRLAADFGAPIRNPMWWNGRIYFITDKSGADNIWSMDEAGGDIQQHSQSARWQMRDPYLFGGRIVYQSGADLYEFDIASGDTKMLALGNGPSDGDEARHRWLSSPLQFMSDARPSPDGKSVTVTARGHFVTAFTGERRRIEYAIPETARARSAAIGSSGDWLYVIIDQNRDSEVWRYPADGSGKGEALNIKSDAYIWGIWPSPHDETLLYSDKLGRLFLFDVETQTSKQIDQTQSSSDDAFGEYTWSSDGRYIAWLSVDRRDLSQITLFDTKTDRKEVVTTGKYQSYAPAFSADDKWLYFISDRNFDATPGAPWGDRNMGPSFPERSELFALQLDPTADFPFIEPDELMLARKEAEEAAKKKEEEEAAKSKKASSKKDKDAEETKDDSEITFDNLSTRLFKLPVPPGEYNKLLATKSHLFVISGKDDERALERMPISPEEPQLKAYAAGARDAELSADGSTLYVQIGTEAATKFVLVDPTKPFPSKPDSQTIRLRDWKLELNPKAEWQQMVADAWRLHKDFAFDPGLRAVDWDAVGDHFVPMAARIGARSELNDLLAQMSAELGILHSQIRPGDLPSDTENAQPAFLGAQYEAVSDGLKIKHIYKAEADLPETLGPLMMPDTDFAPGDVITAINGRGIASLPALYNALEMQAGAQILVDYRRGSEAKKAIVYPVSGRQEAMLEYRDWVETNREAVKSLTGNKIGYMHMRAMSSGDIASFARDFYEHFDKDGLIIDVRGNRGGSIDSWVIATLLRKSWAFWGDLESGSKFANMQQSFRGHLVILIDEGTYSDGETFAAGVKALDLAPLIGTRTAGAGIWLSDRNRLVDGGQARVAEYPQYGMDGRWLLEGLGVGPDIDVDTAPHAAYQGEDAQLQTAIDWLKDKIAAEPIPQLIPQPISPVGTPGRDVD